MKSFSSAKEACAYHVHWDGGGAKGVDYGRTPVSGGQFVQPATGGYALVVLSRILARLEARQKSALTWLCYRAWRLQGEYATPSFRDLSKAHNARAPEGERVSHTTIQRRLEAIDEAMVQELIREGLWSPDRMGEERA